MDIWIQNNSSIKIDSSEKIDDKDNFYNAIIGAKYSQMK